MSISVISDPSGTSGKINIGNTTVATFDSTGIIVSGSSPSTGDRSNKLATTQMFANEFSSSFNVYGGWQKLPSGLIIQWGQLQINGNQVVSFPITFPNQVLNLQATDRGWGMHDVGIEILNTSTFRAYGGFYAGNTNLTYESTGFGWFAMGN